MRRQRREEIKKLKKEKKEEKEKKKQRKRKQNKHHRLPKSHGGTSAEGNITEVDIEAHKDYHGLLKTYSPEEVAVLLTKIWLPLRACLVCVPTNRITEILELFHQKGIIESPDPEKHGVTENHLRYHGTPAEQLERIPVYPPQKQKKRPGT